MAAKRCDVERGRRGRQETFRPPHQRFAVPVRLREWLRDVAEGATEQGGRPEDDLRDAERRWSLVFRYALFRDQTKYFVELK